MSKPKMTDASHTIRSGEQLVTVTLQMPLEQFEAFAKTVDTSGVSKAQLEHIAESAKRLRERE